MAEILSTNDITVLGGPAEISLDLDFGPTGERGSKIFVNFGNPNDATFLDDPILYDMYIDVDTSSEDYRSMYHYIKVAGTDTWVKVLNLTPNIFSKNAVMSFNSGLATINIPVISIIPGALASEYSAENFNVQASLINTDNPIAIKVSIPELIVDNDVSALSISISAIEYSSGEWTDLVGQQMAHLFISVV